MCILSHADKNHAWWTTSIIILTKILYADKNQAWWCKFWVLGAKLRTYWWQKSVSSTLFTLSSNLRRMYSTILVLIFSVKCNFLNTRFSLHILTAPGVVLNLCCLVPDLCVIMVFGELKGKIEYVEWWPICFLTVWEYIGHPGLYIVLTVGYCMRRP